MLKLQKIIKYSLLAVFLMPLIYTTWTKYPAHFGKTVFFQILIEIIVILAYYYIFINKKEVIKLRKIDLAIIIFTGILFLSSIFGLNFERSFWGDQSRVQGVFTLIHFSLFYLFLRFFYTNKKDWNLVLFFILLVSLLSSLIAFFGPYNPWIAQFIPEKGRLSGLIGNPIFFSNYLMIPMFLGFFSFYNLEKRNMWRWGALVVGLINLITIIATQTRGALVGLILGVITVYLGYLLFSNNKKNKIISSSAVILVLAVFIIGLFSGTFREVLPSKLSYVYSINLNQVTAKTRLMAWQIAIKGWQDSPILGNGPESFQDVFDTNYNPNFLKYSFAETVWDQPHNYILEILSATGIVGLISYLLILFYIFKILINLIRNSETENKKISFIILAGAIAAYIGALLFSFETSNSIHLWFALLAFIVFLKYSGEEKTEIKLKDILTNFIFFVLIIVALFSLYQNYLMLKGSYNLAYARAATVEKDMILWQDYAKKAINVPTVLKWDNAIFLMKDINELDALSINLREPLSVVGFEIKEILEERVEKYPHSFLFKFYLGQLYTHLGEYADEKYYVDSEKMLIQALEINTERQHVPLALGKLYFLQGNNKKTIEVLERLADKSEEYPGPHWFLGIALVSDEQLKKGVEELKKGQGFGISSNSNILFLIDTYAQAGEYEEIISLYKILITREPSNSSYYARIAATYVATGDKKNALEYLNRAVELDPTLLEEARIFIKDNGLLE